MRILVTGGAGFIGSALCKRLRGDGHVVVAFDDFSRGKAHRLPPPGPLMRLYCGDIRNKKDVGSAMFNCDVVFHLAYLQGTQTFYSDPQKVIEVALKGIVNVLDAAKVQGGKELFLLSSSEVYQKPPSYPTAEDVPLSVPDVTNPRYSYGGGKIASEIAALAYSDVLKRVVIARPHNIYGPDMGWEHVIPQVAQRMMKLPALIERAYGGKQVFPIHGSGEETRSFCFIDDCIDALMLLLLRGQHRGIYHIGNPEEVSIMQLHEAIAWQLERDFNWLVNPGKLHPGSPTRRLPDISKLRALGYEPQVPLGNGLIPTLEWYRANV